MRAFRKRCRVADDGCEVESMVAGGLQTLSSRLDRAMALFPLSNENIKDAKGFVRGLVCLPSDHNITRLGFPCPVLLFSHACQALELDSVIDGNFAWDRDITVQDALRHMASIPGAPAALQPCRVSAVPRYQWKVGSPCFLPKWKAPGIKWRRIIDKKLTPCNRLHGIVCRCIDVLLDNYPHHLWSDFGTPSDFVSEVRFFKGRARQLSR